MAVKKGKTRIIFTLPEKQANWLKTTAKKTGITTSTLIRWLIDKNISNLQRWAQTTEEYDRLIRILKTPWLPIKEETEKIYEDNTSIFFDAHPEDDDEED